MAVIRYAEAVGRTVSSLAACVTSGFGLEGGEQGKTKAGWRLLCCCHETKLRD
jgi:hypothetical protein